MPKFVFTATDAHGQPRKGQIEAESEAVARSAVAAKGLQIREIGLAREPAAAVVLHDVPAAEESLSNQAHSPRADGLTGIRRGGGLFSAAGDGRLGRVLLLSGILLVLLARGCDSVGARGAARARAALESAQTKFNRQWQKKITDAKDNAEKNKLRQEMDKERKDLEEHAWLSLREDVEAVGTGNQMWGFWREIGFVLGTLLLAAGAVVGAFSGTPAERVFCMIIAAVITFSLYIGGIAWISAVVNAAGGLK